MLCSPWEYKCGEVSRQVHKLLNSDCNMEACVDWHLILYFTMYYLPKKTCNVKCKYLECLVQWKILETQ